MQKSKNIIDDASTKYDIQVGTDNALSYHTNNQQPPTNNLQPRIHNLIYIEDILTRSQAISVTRITTPENVTEMQINCRLR